MNNQTINTELDIICQHKASASCLLRAISASRTAERGTESYISQKKLTKKAIEQQNIIAINFCHTLSDAHGHASAYWEEIVNDILDLDMREQQKITSRLRDVIRAPAAKRATLQQVIDLLNRRVSWNRKNSRTSGSKELKYILGRITAHHTDVRSIEALDD